VLVGHRSGPWLVIAAAFHFQIVAVGSITILVIRLVASAIVSRLAPRVSPVVVAVTTRRAGLVATSTPTLIASPATTALIAPAIIAPAPTALLATVPVLATGLLFALFTSAAPLSFLLSASSLAIAAHRSFAGRTWLLGVSRPRSRSIRAPCVAACCAAHERFDLRSAAGLHRRFAGRLRFGRHFDSQLAGDVAPVGGGPGFFWGRGFWSQILRRRRLDGSCGGGFGLCGRLDSQLIHEGGPGIRRRWFGHCVVVQSDVAAPLAPRKNLSIRGREMAGKSGRI
jgi:hypothetical protein